MHCCEDDLVRWCFCSRQSRCCVYCLLDFPILWGKSVSYQKTNSAGNELKVIRFVMFSRKWWWRIHSLCSLHWSVELSLFLLVETENLLNESVMSQTCPVQSERGLLKCLPLIHTGNSPELRAKNMEENNSGTDRQGSFFLGGGVCNSFLFLFFGSFCPLSLTKALPRLNKFFSLTSNWKEKHVHGRKESC